jgi:glycosyltransferase involved in cell wall biosynthesis
LAGFYGCLDVYVHTAEWEGFGIPVVEAMACGVPVIASATQGPAELLPYCRTIVREGEVVEDNGTRLFHVDAPSLAATMGRVGFDRTQCEELSRLGRKAAVERFDVCRVVDLWETVVAESAPLRS